MGSNEHCCGGDDVVSPEPSMGFAVAPSPVPHGARRPQTR
jgi:hypothetical protein